MILQNTECRMAYDMFLLMLSYSYYDEMFIKIYLMQTMNSMCYLWL